MSTILDALKRSEQERKLNKVPTLSDMPAPQERSRWPLLVVALLILILLALLIWFFVAKKGPQAEAQEIVISNETVNVDSAADGSSNSDTVNVNVITYAEEPTARFVIINGKMFREGQFVMAGVMVESINQDSVVLIERGKRITRKP